MFPLVFSLLPKRDKDTSDSSLFSKRYAGATTRPYRQLQSAWTSSVLQHIAVVETFPIAELKGCLFHYWKAIWKKTQECGLKGLQNPTWSEHTCSSCSSSASSTSRQSYGLLAAHSGKCTRQRGLYQTHRLCNRDMYRGQILPIYSESLSGWGTQNQPEGWHKLKKRVKIKLCDYWGIKEGAGSKWRKDVPVCNWWQEEKKQWRSIER